MTQFIKIYHKIDIRTTNYRFFLKEGIFLFVDIIDIKGRYYLVNARKIVKIDSFRDMFVVKSVISEPIFIDKKEFEKLSKVLKDQMI